MNKKIFLFSIVAVAISLFAFNVSKTLADEDSSYYDYNADINSDWTPDATDNGQTDLGTECNNGNMDACTALGNNAADEIPEKTCDPLCDPSESCQNGTCVSAMGERCDPACKDTEACQRGTCVSINQPESNKKSGSCNDDLDCANGYTCSGWFTKTCEQSSKTVASTTKPTNVIDKDSGKTVTVPAGAQVRSDGSVWSSDGQTQLAAANSIPGASSLSSSSGSTMLCANGIIGTTCSVSGGSPLSIGAGSYSPSAGVPSSGAVYNTGSVNGLAGQACGNGFVSVGGVCFPATTGLSAAPISVILANIFSWLMGLFTTFAVAAFIISGVQYLVSAGDTDMIESAKRNAMYALLGVIIGLSGFVIVKAIAAALSGQSYFF